MDSLSQRVLSLIVLRVVIGSIHQVFVGSGRHAERGFLSVVLLISSFFSPPTLYIVEKTRLERTWLVDSCYHFPVEGQVE
jgi:hypothetical protein